LLEKPGAYRFVVMEANFPSNPTKSLGFTHIVEKSGPPYIQTWYTLNHNLFGVTPKIFVPRVTATEADHCLNFRESGRKGAILLEIFQKGVGILRDE
jgi:hypothetical protein